MTNLISYWSYALAALFYAGLTVWQLRQNNQKQLNRPLVIAFAAMAGWAFSQGVTGPHSMVSALTESARNLAFLNYMYAMIRDAADDHRQRAVKTVYGAVASVIGIQIILAFIAPQFRNDAMIDSAMTSTAHSLGLAIAAGSLVLVHNLYGQASPASRIALQFPVIALAAMWAYDLHLYTFSYLTGQNDNALFAFRGAMAAMLFPLFALASKSGTEWRVKLSRSATFQSLSLIAILAYFIIMMSLTRAMERLDGEWVQIAQLGLIMGMTGLALLLLPSAKARAWFRVIISKHFFEHRYDYRADWLRFTQAIGRSGEDETPLEQRIVKALAEMAGSPGGLLLMVDNQYRFTPAACWNWHDSQELSGEAGHDLIRFLESGSYVIDFSTIENDLLSLGSAKVQMPAWLCQSSNAWAGIPLIHNDQLVGLTILSRPISRRQLDWEDYDLFRTAGIQAASYIAEAQSHAALADAQKFDEFNRRFAFIMHDIKNLVSQLSLVAHNAERHADNPDFRADMVATLQSSVKKMNDLLARLSHSNKGDPQQVQPIRLHPIIAAVAEAKCHLHPIELSVDPQIKAKADPVRLEQALAHIVQNAIDASPHDMPVRITCAVRKKQVAIDVVDNGCGMSAEFIRTRLFQPFASTKENGFGIGAFETRTLITSMGGHIDVASQEGKGSRFTIVLPIAEMESAPPSQRKTQRTRV